MTMMDTAADTLEQPSREDLERAAEVRLKVKAGLSVPRQDLEHAAHVRLLLKAKSPQRPTPATPATTAANPVWGQLAAQAAQDAPQAAADATAAFQGRYGLPEEEVPPSPANASLGPGGYQAPPAPPARGILGEAANAFQAGAQGIEAGIGRAGAAVGDVAGRLGYHGLEAQLGQGRTGGVLTPAGAPSVLPDDTNPFYAAAYKGTRLVAGAAPALAAGMVAGPLAGGGLSGLLAGASPMALQAGGDTYQQAKDAGLPMHTALGSGLAAAAVGELVGTTQLGTVLRQFPGLGVGVQNLAQKRIAAYLAERGAEASFNGAVGVAQQAANDAIHVASGMNPDAFDKFWSEQAPEAFAGGALPTAVAGAVHDAAALPGAIGAQRQQADLQRAQQGATDAARTLAPGVAPAVQQRVEGPTPPIQRTTPPPGGVGPPASEPQAGGTPDQPAARAAGSPGGDGTPTPQDHLKSAFAAAEALRNRLATVLGVEPTPPAESGRDVPPAESQAQTATPNPAEANPGETNPPDVIARAQAVADRVNPALTAWRAAYAEMERARAAAQADPYDVSLKHAAEAAAHAEQEASRSYDDVADMQSHTVIGQLDKGQTIDPSILAYAESLIRQADKYPRRKPPAAATPPPTSSTTKFTPRPPQPARQPAGEADLGSSRLQIPLSVVPPEVRRADATNRAGVRDATNKILNPPQRGYTTEGSLTPEEVMPQEPAPEAGPRRSFLRAKEEPRRSFLRPREQAAPQAPEPPAGDRGKQNPNLPAWLEEDMVAQGKNPRRLLNDIDAERPQAKAQLANDKLTKFYDETGNTTMADRMRRGDLSAEEYRQGLAEMKAAVPRGTPERIAGTAIKLDDGAVVTGGPRPHGAIEVPEGRTVAADGFVTSGGRFVDRKEALRIAQEGEQVRSGITVEDVQHGGKLGQDDVEAWAPPKPPPAGPAKRSEAPEMFEGKEVTRTEKEYEAKMRLWEDAVNADDARIKEKYENTSPDRYFVGDIVTGTGADGKRIDGTVVWARDGRYGIADLTRGIGEDPSGNSVPEAKPEILRTPGDERLAHDGFQKTAGRAPWPPDAPPPAARKSSKRKVAGQGTLEAGTPAPRQPWSRSDLEARIAREHSNSAKTQAEAAQQHIEDTSSTAGDFSQAHRFKGPIPADLEPYLEGRPDLRKMLQPNAVGRGRSGEDHLAELGADEYIRRLEGDRRKRTKDQVKDLHADPSNPQGQMLADLYVTHKGKESAPKESLKPEDIAEPGTTWTVDGRPARVMKQKGDLTVQIKGLGEYPLAALDEIPADRGTLKKAGKLAAAETKLGDLAAEALKRVKKGPGIKRGRNTGAEIISTKLVDLATYLGLKAAQTGVRGARVTIEAARAALDRFTGHGKYGDEEAQRAVRMGNALLRRSKNKFGGIDPARLEANIGKAYEVAQRSERRTAKRAPGPGDTRPDSQGAVDAAVALERQSADVRVGMAQRAGANKAKALRAAMSEQARGARAEMAQERRAARDRLIDETTTLKAKALRLSYAAAERAGEAGSRETAKELKAFGREAAKIVLTNLPRSERGRSVIIRAIRGATRVKDIQRLIDEVQHRAVSARAADAWKVIKKQTKRERIAALPEKAESIPGIPDGTNVRAHVRQLLEEAKAARQTASNMKAQPVALAKYLRARAQWMVMAKDPTTTVAARQTARAKLREIRDRLLDTRPDLAPKVAAAARLKEIGRQVKETAHLVKHADDVYTANERRSARWMRKNTTARMELAPPLADDSAETVPGISDGSKQFVGKALLFHTFTPDTMGQWMDNALGKPDVANFAHHLLYKMPLQAKARVAEEQIKRLAALDALSKKHGFDDFDHARAVISGHLGGGLQETVPIDVPGWPDKKITVGEALKIMGDDQDAQTRALSDDGMVHRLNRRRNGNTTTLGPDERAAIIDAIPKRFRDFYTEFKDLKEKSLGLRALELRRKIKGTAPDSVPLREPRLREADSDYVTDLFDKKAQSGSLLEQSFMKDRTNTPGPVNLIIDGLESHMHDWDAQLHMIHHVELAQAIGKTLLHKDTLKALATHGGDAAVQRLQTTVDRLMGTEVKMKPTAVDSVAKALKKNIGAGMTGLSPRTFVKQFSTMPLLAGLFPKDFLPALKGMTKKGLRERMMAANGLIAQRMHMADAAKAASAGTSNPIVDTGDIKLRWNAAKGNLSHAREQIGKGQLRNAAANARRAAGNARDAIFNGIRLNSWADEQGVKLAFLIQEQQVNREHPNLNAAEREKMIGERTAEVVHRTMNTYDPLGQAFWRSDLDQSAAAGVLNMFSNDSTKQANLILQAGASGDKKLMARTALGIAGSMAVSVLAPFFLLALGNKTLRATLGASDTEEDRNKNLRSKLLAAAGREVIGKAPIPFADTLFDFTKAMATGQGDVNAADNPVTTTVSTFAREMALAIYHGTKLATAEDDPDKTGVQNFEDRQKRIGRATSALWASARNGGTLAGVGVMPVIALLRSMTPEREPYGLAAEAAKAGKDARASTVLAERVAAMRKAGLEDPDIKEHMITTLTIRLNRGVAKDDRQTRQENARLARSIVAGAM